MKVPSLLAICLVPHVAAQDHVLELGPSAVVTFPHDAIMNTTDRFTVEWWMSASPDATGVVWPFWRYSPSAEHKATQVTPDGRVRFLYAGSPWTEGFEASTALSTEAAAFPVNGTWHHVAFVRHLDATYAVYVDGTLAHGGGPGPCWSTCGIINAEAPTEILRADSAATGWRIRDLRVSAIDRYTGAFLPTADYTPDLDTVMLAPLDEGTGQVLFDHGPAAQVGEITGSFEWVPDTTASAAYRLGSGINPTWYVTTSLPLVGGLWTSEIDTSASTSGNSSTWILAASTPAAPVQTPFGEILIGVPPFGGIQLFLSLVTTFGPTAHHLIGVPSSAALVGLPIYTQGLVLDEDVATLCNGIDLTLGY